MADSKTVPGCGNDTPVADTAIIGAGLAGLAAAVYAVNAGLNVTRVGSTGGVAYTTGYLDILAVPDLSCEVSPANPYDGLKSLRAAKPEHPYTKLADADIAAAFDTFLAFLAEAGLPYVARDNNIITLSPMGTVKKTHAVPQTMLAGAEAFANRTPCLLVDFKGLKAFSAKGIAAALAETWPGITPVTLPFPDLQWAGELYPEAMARCLEVAATREALAASIRPHIGNAKCVGMPAVLGIYRSADVHAHMEKLLGVPVFELPTLPPGVPGIRLREALDDALREKGANMFAQRYVFGIRKQDGLFLVDIGESRPEFTIKAKSLVLATGRFLSGGLVADRVRGICEPLLDLAVSFPEDRDAWHRADCFDPEGHAVNRSGVVTDETFRPLAKSGGVFDENLYAAGTILAGQDWIREKSGAGIALASAYKAVSALAKRMKEAS